MGEGALRSYVVSHRDSTERHFVLCVGSSLCQQRQGSFLCQQRQGCAFGTLRRAKGSGGDEAKGPTIGLRTGPTPCAPGHGAFYGRCGYGACGVGACVTAECEDQARGRTCHVATSGVAAGTVTSTP
eukprot:3645202-Pyramimonas_sp.AAC.1